MVIAVGLMMTAAAVVIAVPFEGEIAVVDEVKFEAVEYMIAAAFVDAVDRGIALPEMVIAVVVC